MMNWNRCLLAPCLLLILVMGNIRAADVTPRDFRLDPDLPYRAVPDNPVSYDVDFSVVITAPYHTKVLKVWLPLPPSDVAQQITNRQLNTCPQNVTPEIACEPLYGNQFAYFEFHDPQGGQIIRHRFRAKVWQLRWNIDPADVTAVTSWPTEFNAYLSPQSNLARDAEFRATLNQIVPRPSGRAADLVSVMNWIDQNLSYDHASASLRADAQFAFRERRGHCSDYHGLCATMGRSLGHPTRVTYGLHLLPKSSPSHCKMEAFLPPHGWVSFDLSETQKMVQQIQRDEQLSAQAKDKLASAARQRMLSGFRDNTWLLVTRGTDYRLVPPASQTVPVVRTIYAEADGVPLPDPDPSNPEKREFSWMTVHQFKPDRRVSYPFTDLKSLERAVAAE